MEFRKFEWVEISKREWHYKDSEILYAKLWFDKNDHYDCWGWDWNGIEFIELSDMKRYVELSHKKEVERLKKLLK